MKRGLSFIFLFVLVLSIFVVSAFSFSNIWGKITGKVISEINCDDEQCVKVFWKSDEVVKINNNYFIGVSCPDGWEVYSLKCYHSQ
jgi:uracil DNA glycosylase